MEQQLSSAAFFLSVAFLSKIEVKRFNNLITPFTVTALPLVVISILVNYIYVPLGISPVTVRVNFFLLANCLIIWCIGSMVYYFYPLKIKLSTNQFFSNFEKFEPYKIPLSVLALIIAVITFYKVKSIIGAYGLPYLATDDFEKDMTSGFVAHIIVFGKSLFIFLFLISKKSDKKYITYPALIILGLSIFMLMVKYHLLWLIIMVFFINNFFKPIKTQLMRVTRISIVLFSFLTFYFVFLTIFWQTFSFTNLNIWEFFYKQVMNYFLTAPIVLDNWLNYPSSKPDWALFVVPLNLIKVIVGNPARLGSVDIVSNGFHHVGLDIYSNVGTSFGVYYLIGGLAFTFVATAIIATISYSLYIKSFEVKNVLVVFLSLFFLTLGTLNFFVQYFTLLSFYQFPIYFLVIYWALKTINLIKEPTPIRNR